jgi:hypothetical protein
MKSSQVCVGLLALFGVAQACATGTKADITGVPPVVDPTQTTEPTEPPPPSVSVPPPSTEDEPSDAGAEASSEDASSTPVKDAGSSKPDAAPTCVTAPPSNSCGVAPQCGCAAGETCEIADKKTGAVSCIAAGDRVLAAVCTTTSQCAPGLTCVFGACRPYCSTVNTACTGTGLGLCNQGYDTAGNAVPNGKICTLTCEPRNPSAACGANTCVWDKNLGTTDCDMAGIRTARQPCKEYSDCAPGFQCATHPVVGMECERWCRVGHDDDCDALQTCKDVYDANGPKEGADKLGLCQ